MIARNGIRSTVRARGRTALFACLIFVLTVTLTLGGGLWAYCAAALEALDGQYTSIALVEYMGEDYPAVNQADEGAREAAQTLSDADIAAIAGVERWERDDCTLARVEGYARSGLEAPYGEYGVIVVSSLAPAYHTVMGELAEDEVAEEFFAANYETGLCVVRMADAEYTEIPFFFYDGETYTRYTAAGGEETVEAAQLGETYVTVGTGRKVGIAVHDGGAERAVPLNLPQYTYGEVGVYFGEQEEVYGYTGIISRAVYTREGKDNVALTVEIGESGFEAQKGQRYLLHGRFVESGTSNRAFAITDFYEGCQTPPYLAVEGADDPALTDSLFADYARRYAAVNNYVDVTASDDIAALEAFQQGTLYLEQGRFPAAGETGVCAVSGDMAAQLGLGVGDAMSLTVMESGSADRFDAALTQDVRALTVVGVTNQVKGYGGLVWVSAGEGGFGAPLFGDSLGRAVLDNARGRSAADALGAMMPPGVQVTLLDQGYSAAAQPLETMRTTALAITAAAACAAAAVLFLFACLFVGRQRETVAILVSLGAGAGKIRLWLLSGAAVVSGGAAALGGLAGAASMNRITRAALEGARRLYDADRRYSEAALGVVREVSDSGSAPLWPAVAAPILVFAASLLLCLAFLRSARREAAPRRGRVRVRVPRGGTSTALCGPARFAMLSARRGGARSAVVPAAALVLSLFLGLLASTAQGWSGQMDALYTDTVVTGQVCSASGRQLTGLAVSAQNARLLWKSGLLADEHVATSFHYWLPAEMPAFGSSGFAQETRDAWIAQQPSLVALDDLSAAPEFYYGDVPAVEWLEGYDESVLACAEYGSVLRAMRFYFGKGTFEPETQELPEYPCIVSRSFLERRGLALGDTLTVAARIPAPDFDRDGYIPLRVVGAFSGTGSRENLYVPLSFWCSKDWITGAQDMLPDGQRAQYPFSTAAERDVYFYSITTFTTCRFTLADPAGLGALREYLAGEGFSQSGRLNKNRTAVLLRDQTFTETVGSLGRYITFSRILFPVLFLAVGLLGFVISWLMVNSRRMEFAMMRGLGASRGRVFASFFLEQAALCLLGCLIGCLALLPLGGGGGRYLAVLAFLGCYLVGCALSVLAVGRTHLMTLLSQRE